MGARHTEQLITSDLEVPCLTPTKHNTLKAYVMYVKGHELGWCITVVFCFNDTRVSSQVHVMNKNNGTSFCTSSLNTVVVSSPLPQRLGTEPIRKRLPNYTHTTVPYVVIQII